MTKKQTVKYYIVLLIFAVIYWLIDLTPINLHNRGTFIRIIILSILIILPFFIRFNKSSNKKTKSSPLEDIELKVKSFKDIFKKGSGNALIWIPILLVLIYAGLGLTSAKIFRSRDYADLLQTEEGDFTGNIAEIAFTDIPTVDHQTAQRLGSKKMGEITSLVSQFEVSPEYPQINYQGRPVRVTPLRYGNIIKWFNNRSEGLPRLIRVDMIDSSVTLQPLSSGMKYSQSEPFFRNINRHLRLRYPFDILDNPVMEVDDEGTPFWITPVLKPTVGWFGGQDVTGIILCNALTGETIKHDIENIPNWIDRVFPAKLILDHISYYGKYQDGYINAFFGQKGVLEVTDLYNYLAIDDDVYLYTGITSVSMEDNSNLGFVLVNLRTKQTDYYAIPSADESSAMNSAQGAVQEKGYNATIPILLNINGRPSYCMALKDNAQLVKMYALVDAQNYQTTGVGSSIKEAMQNYEISQNSRLRNEPMTDENKKVAVTLTGDIANIQNITLDGNTFYYFMLEADETQTGEQSDQEKYWENQVFSAPVTLSSQLPFLVEGDEIEIQFSSTTLPEDMTEEEINQTSMKVIEIDFLNIK